MAVNQMPGDRHAMKMSRRNYPWMLGGLIIGADAGLLSGMAYANTFTRDLVALLLWSVGGAIVTGAVLGGIGWLIDNSRNRPRSS
jgi:hypothetical protein